MPFQDEYFNTVPLPVRLSFATAGARYDELTDKRRLLTQTRAFPLSRFTGREADLFVGETPSGRARVDADGTLSVVAGAVPELPAVEVRISVSLGSAVLLPTALPLAEGAIVVLSHATGDPVCVRFSGRTDGWATGELVLIDSTLGVRLGSMTACAPSRPAAPNGIVTHVPLGSMLLDVTDLDQVGEGTILGLSHQITQPFRLVSGSTPLAEGYLRSVLPGEVTARQDWGEAGPPNPGVPLVAFVVTRSLLPGAISAVDPVAPSTPSGETVTPTPLQFLLSSLAASRVANLIAQCDPLIAGWLLRVLASTNASAAGDQLRRALDAGRDEAVRAFLTCNPHNTDRSVQWAVAGYVAGLLSSEELDQAATEAEALSDGSTDALPSGIDEAARIVVGALGGVPERLVAPILAELETDQPESFAGVREQLFFFEDIARLDDRSIQKVLREVDIKDLVHALAGASADTKEAITRNMSKRAAEMLEEEIRYAGTPNDAAVDKSRLLIRGVVAKLVEYGEIVA